MISDARFKDKLSKPSVSFYGTNLYLQAPPVLEEMTRPNLNKKLLELMEGNTAGVLNINDKKLNGILRIRPKFNTKAAAEGG